VPPITPNVSPDTCALLNYLVRRHGEKLFDPGEYPRQVLDVEFDQFGTMLCSVGRVIVSLALTR
jgi:hypothetical protein